MTSEAASKESQETSIEVPDVPSLAIISGRLSRDLPARLLGDS